MVDASAVVELLLRTTAGLAVERTIEDSSLAAPAHLDAEVLSALGRLTRGGEVPEERVAPALEALARAPIRRYPLEPLLAEVWALRANVSLRDGLYLALAQELRAPLLTTDGRLARAPGFGVEVRTPL